MPSVPSATVRRVGLRGWDVFVAAARGRDRREMEDAFEIIRDVSFQGRRCDAVAVFDGMGGLPNGARAAQAAARHFELALVESATPRAVIRRLNEAVLATGGGAVMAALILPHEPGWEAILLSVGDVGSYGDSGSGGLASLAPKDQLDAHHVTDHLGRLGCYGHIRRLSGKERLLLCSDGVDGVVDTSDLTATIHTPADDASGAIKRLFARVDERGRPDDATAVLVLKSSIG